MTSKPSNKRIGTIVCACFNILAGGAGVFAGAVLTWMTLTMGGRASEAGIALSFAVGGGLYALAGICLLLPSGRGWKTAIALQGAAILCGTIYLVLILLVNEGDLRLDPHDEEVVMFLLLPAAAIVIATMELGYLWWKTPPA
jgi:uncharacterized membrane protein